MEIFETTDEELALALLTAGARLAGSEDGLIPPCINHYTPDTCRDRRLLTKEAVKPQVFELAVIRARENKIPGIVTWRIWKDAEFERAMKAWDAMVKEMYESDRDKRAPNLPAISTETVMQALYLRRLNHKPMKDHIWVVCPSLSLMKTSRAQKPLPSTNPAQRGMEGPMPAETTVASGTIWNLNTSSENREKIGAPKRP